MSDAQALPPPPPPPPPPQPPATPQFDFGKPFTYVFDDPRWANKVLLGGLFFLACFFFVGWFFILGYMARVARNVIAGVEHPLPEWDDAGAYFTEGARLVGVALIYILPFVFVFGALMIPAAILTDMDSEAAQAVGGVMMGCLSCVALPIFLAMFVFLPASLLFAAVEQRFGAAFEFGRIWSFITRNIGNYLLAIVIFIIARFVAWFGFFLLCIGLLFTGFWSVLVTAHAFAQVYRLDPRNAAPR